MPKLESVPLGLRFYHIENQIFFYRNQHYDRNLGLVKKS